MELNFNSRLEEYYQKFIELQEKLKRSEEQRFMLEMKFNEMVQVAKDEEQHHYRKLRAQYKRFLEEDEKRQDRNERIIRNLERIEARITMLSAKTERISMFRRQYQKYLRRIVDSNPEKKITDSKISRERSFIKEAPLKKQQQTLFRDDYSLPERPKEILDQDELFYEHPAVKKCIEKDRSNEEKIEILDKYLQNISSQRCRDVLNQERQAREKLSLDMPVDKLFNNDFLSTSSNHATAVADDIMNSIYSRYYTKGEVSPKSNKTNLPTDIQNENIQKSDYTKKEFQFDDKGYLGSLLSKNVDSGVEKNKPIVTFKKEEELLPLKENPNNNTGNKDSEKSLRPLNVTNNFSNNLESNDMSYHFQDQNKQDSILKNAERKQDILRGAPENNVRNNIDKNKNSINDNLYKNGIQAVETVQDERIIRSVSPKDIRNNNKQDIFNGVGGDRDITKENVLNETNNHPSVRTDLKENKQFESSNVPIPNPNIVPSDDQQNNGNEKVNLQYPSQEPIMKYDITNPHYENENKDQLQEKDEFKYQSQEQLVEFDANNQHNLTKKPYNPKEQFNQPNLQNKDKQYQPAKNQNINSLVDLEVTQNNPGSHNQPSMQYDQNVESGQPIQHDQSKQPPLYDQTQHENPQSVQYNPQDPTPVHYDENSAQPAQFNETKQPIKFVENDPSYQQYNENEQPIQYDENGQPTGYDQYGQPLLYDQNGQIVQPQYDENGQLIPQYDENGQMVILYDHNGQQLFSDQYKANEQQYDLNGQPVQYDENGQPVQYDENGQPIYDPSQQQYYDYSTQEQTNPSNEYNQYQGDDQGHYIEPQESQLQSQTEGNYYQAGDQESYPHVEGNQIEGDEYQVGAGYNQSQENTEGMQNYIEPQESQLQSQTEGNYYQAGDQESYPHVEGNQIEGDEYQVGAGYNQSQEYTEGMQNVTIENEDGKAAFEETEKNNEIAKPTNVMDILDTDTESAKQNSKISNESDFDFS